MTKEMTGAEMVIQALADQGVEHIFGYPGGAVLPIYDALFQQERLKHILVRHEQGAVHAAEGYARSTGKVGCVLVTSGPGATNAVTGLTDALMDSIPLVVHHRAGADAPDRQRRVPGMRHGRHHAALHQAQLPGEERQRPGARAARGVPHRGDRPARPGGGRHPEGRPVRQGRLCRADQDVPAPELQAEGQGRPRQDQGRGRDDGAAPSGRSSIPAAASSIPARRRATCCASSSGSPAFRSPRR